MDMGCNEAAVWPAVEGDIISVGCSVGYTVAGEPMGANAQQISTVCSNGAWQGAALPQLQCVPAFPVWLPPFNLSVPENSDVNTPVGPPLQATVIGAATTTISYAIVGGNVDPISGVSNVFKIDSCSGQVRVAVGGVLNYESAPNYTLTVAAIPGGYAPSEVTHNVTINLINEPEPPVVFSTNMSIHETAVIGSSLLSGPSGGGGGLVFCHDPDGDPCVWAITGGNAYVAPLMSPLQMAALAATAGAVPSDGSLLFAISAINASAARVTRAVGPGGLDAVNRPRVVLSVTASKPYNASTFVGSGSVVINIIPDAQPPVIIPGQLFTVSESAAKAASAYSPANASVSVSVWDPNARPGVPGAASEVLVYTLTGLWGGALSDGTTGAAYSGPASSWPVGVYSTSGLLFLRAPLVVTDSTADVMLTQSGGAGATLLTRAAYTATLSVTDSARLSDAVNVSFWVLVDGTGLAGALITGVIVPSPSAPSTGGGLFSLTGENLGALGVLNLTVSYGPYTAVGCGLVNSSSGAVISCAMSAGTGKSLGLVVWAGGSFVRLSSAFSLSYDPPTLTSVSSYPPGDATFGNASLAAGAGAGTPSALRTQGGEVFVIEGANFGSDTGAVNVLCGVYNGTYTALTLLEVHDTWMSVVSAPGVGAGLPLSITVSGQSCGSSCGSAAVTYAPPSLSAIIGAAPSTSLSSLSTLGGEDIVLSGSNFGPLSAPLPIITLGWSLAPSDGSYIYTLMRCRRPMDSVLAHVQVTCSSVAGVGSGLFVAINVGGQSSSPAHDYANYYNASAPPPMLLSYSPPSISRVSGPGALNADTAGGQSITLFGSGFGPAALNGVSSSSVLSVYWGTGGAGVRYGPFGAVACAVVDTNTINCLSDEGTGAGYAWSVCIAGQCASSSSGGGSAGVGGGVVPMSYGPPSIFAFSGVGATAASTAGGDQVCVVTLVLIL